MNREKNLKNLNLSRNIYVFVHGNRRLYPIVENVCLILGFKKSQIIKGKSTKVGDVGDYTASAWHPRNPDHIKISEITKVIKKTKRIIGLWAGVTTHEIDVIPLPEAAARNGKIKFYMISAGLATIVGAFIYEHIRHSSAL